MGVFRMHTALLSTFACPIIVEFLDVWFSNASRFASFDPTTRVYSIGAHQQRLEAQVHRRSIHAVVRLYINDLPGSFPQDQDTPVFLIKVAGCSA